MRLNEIIIEAKTQYNLELSKLYAKFLRTADKTIPKQIKKEFGDREYNLFKWWLDRGYRHIKELLKPDNKLFSTPDLKTGVSWSAYSLLSEIVSSDAVDPKIVLTPGQYALLVKKAKLAKQVITKGRQFKGKEKKNVEKIAAYTDPIIVKQIEEKLLAMYPRCKQIFSLYKKYPGKYFYRGTNHLMIYYNKTPPKGRRPRDSDEDIHTDIIKAMKANGFKAHRGNSIFMTSDMEQADGYATGPPSRAGQPSRGLYIIFPLDGFNYSWSPKVQDFEGFYKDDPHSLGIDIENGIDEYLRQAEYTNKRIDAALKSGHEVMTNSKYYAISTKYIPIITDYIKNMRS